MTVKRTSSASRSACAAVVLAAVTSAATPARAQQSDHDPWFGRDKAALFAV
jgi:hypothetical protein